MLRTIEIIDRFHVKQLYFDWWIQHESAKPYLKKIAAYYYNKALEWGEDVMIVYKYDAFMFGTANVDIERGQFSEVKPYYWQTDTAIAKNSWCYTEGNDFKKAKDLICDLVDIVSKNGRFKTNNINIVVCFNLSFISKTYFFYVFALANQLHILES